MNLIQEIITGLLCLVVYVALWELTLRSRRNEPFLLRKNIKIVFKSLCYATSDFISSNIQSNGQYPRLLQKAKRFYEPITHSFLTFCKSNRKENRIEYIHLGGFLAPDGQKQANLIRSFFDFNPGLLLRLIWRPRVLAVVLILLAFANVNGATRTASVSGNWSNPATWGGTVPVAGDDVEIGDGVTVTIDVDPPALASLTIGKLAAGTLQYESGNARTVTVNGIVRIKPGSTFRSAPAGSTSTITTHSLVVGQSLINDGTLDFSATAGAGGTTANASGAGITFTGIPNETFDCSAATLTNLRQVNGLILNKGTSASSVLSFTPGNTFQVLSDGSASAKGFLSISNGTFSIIGSNTFSNPVFNSNGSYTIPSTGGLWLGNSNATIIAMDGTVTNLGELKITTGIYNIGISSGNSSETNSSGKFILLDGTLNIAGRFKISGGKGTISGGTMNIATIGHASASEGAFHVTLSADLDISGGLITFTRPNSNAVPFNDIEILNSTGTKTITGGTFQIGTATTPAGSTFKVNSDIPLYNLTVFNSNTKVSLTDNLTVNNQLTLNGQLLLNDKNLTLGITAPSIAGSLGAADGMVVAGPGEIRKMISANGSFTFPVGDVTGTADYTPVTLNFTSGTYAAGAYATVKVFNSRHPNNNNATNFLNRYWAVTTSGITNPVYNVNATYTNTDATGDVTGFIVGSYSTNWSKIIGATFGSNNLTITGATQGITFTALSEPTITITNVPNPAFVCNNSPITLTSTTTADPVATFAWTSIPAGFTGSTQDITVTPTIAGTYNVMVTVTDGNGFTAEDEITVNINPLPTATISGTTAVCQNAIAPNVTFTGATGIAPFTFTYTINGGSNQALATTSGNSVTIAAPTGTAGTFTYSLVSVQDASSTTCSQSQAGTATITVNPTPTVTNAASASTCSGTGPNIALTASTPSSFSWTIGTITGSITGASAGSGATINQVLTNPSNATAGTVQYVVTPTSTTDLCAGTPFTITVTVKPIPVVTATPSSQTFCTGSSTSISLTSSVVGTTFDWTVVQSGVSGASNGSGATIVQTLTATGAYAGTATYSIIPTANGCAGLPVTVVITVNTPPAITLDIADHSTCKDVVVTFTAGASGTPTPTVQWYENGNLMTGQTSITLTLTAAPNMNNNKYKAVFTNICGTATTTEAKLIVGSPLNVDATNTTVISCDGSSGSDVYLTATANGGNGVLLGQWLRSIDNGATWQVIPGTTVTTTNGNLTINYQILGGNSSYLYKAQFINGGCAESYSGIQKLIVVPNSSMTKPSDLTVCNGQPSTAIDFGALAPNANYFNWTNNNTSIGLGASGTVTTTFPSFTATNATANPITATVTVYPMYTGGTNPCQGLPQTFTITVNPSPAAPVGVDGVSCGPGTVTLTTSGCTGGTLNWYNAASGGSLIGNGSPWTTPFLNATTDFWVSCTMNSCEGPRTKTTVIIRPVDPGTIASNQSICSGTVPVLSSLTPATGAPSVTLDIQWEMSTDGGSTWTAIGGATFQSYSPPALTQTTLYHRKVTGTKGGPGWPCIGYSNVVTVTVNPTPTCSITGSNSVCSGSTNSYTSTVLPAGGTVTHLWTITPLGAGTISGSNTGATVTVIANAVCATSTFTITDNSSRDGCTTSCSLVVTVNPPPLPVFNAPPGNTTVACGAIPAPSILSYTNSGTGTCLISGSVTSVQTSPPGPCGGTVTETWSATDACGRALAPVSRIITVSPAALPTMTVLGSVTVACGSVPAASTIAYTNGGAGGCLISGTSNLSTFSAQAPAGACGGTITETWTATDACGRALAPVSRIITISPSALPTMTAPGDITVTCGAVPTTSTLTYTNGLSGTCLITGTSTTSTSTFTTLASNCGGTITETWTATDACNRPLATVSRTITVQDNNKPTVTAQPQNGFSDCVSVDPMLDAGFIAWLANQGGATATDDCDNALDWTNNSATQTWVINLVNHTKTITVTFKATDDCTNFIETSPATYTLNDDLPPTIDCPVNLTGTEPDLFEDFVSGNGCTWIPTTIPNPTFNDICGVTKLTYVLSGATVGVSPATGFNYVSGATLNLGITTVTYTAHDAAGNSRQFLC
ncbi:MAG: hypothetical protein C0397_01890 [Odoribacter sp.]|nr:hypothetical protein [Odoribacter sp.]